MNSEESENTNNPEDTEPNPIEDNVTGTDDNGPTEAPSESKEAEEVKEGEENENNDNNIETNNIEENKERYEIPNEEESKTEEIENTNEPVEGEEMQPPTEDGETQNVEESKEEPQAEEEQPMEETQNVEETKETEPAEEQPPEEAQQVEESKEETEEEGKEAEPTEELKEEPSQEEAKEEAQPVEEAKEEETQNIEETKEAEPSEESKEESQVEDPQEAPVEEGKEEEQPQPVEEGKEESKEEQILIEVPSAAPIESKEGELVTTVAVDLPTNIQQQQQEEQPEGEVEGDYDDTVAPTKEPEEIIYLQQASEENEEGEEENERTIQQQTQPYDMNNNNDNSNDYIDANYNDEEDEYYVSNDGNNETENEEQECVSLSFIHDPKMKSQVVATYLFPINIKFSIVHRKVDQEFKMLEGSKLVYNSITVTDDLTPLDLGMELRRQYIIEIKGDRKPPSPIILSNGNYTLKVQVKDRGEIVKAIDVEVTPCTIRKPFIGGFRKKKSGLEYHDACTNTPRMKTDWANQSSKTHRETQTYEFKTRSIQSKREHGTQMERKDLYIDNKEDKILIPGPYFTAQQLEELKFEKTIVIQRYWRKFIACRRAKELRAERDRINRERDENIQKEDDGAEQKRHREIERRMHPRTTEDFEILYNELENWRYYENKRIKESSLGEKERLEALAQVLYKETQLLQNIDRLKCQAAKENKEENTRRMLDLMSNDKKWAMGDNEIATIETPYTKRASELKELYVGLCDNKKSIDDRLDVLLHIKWTIKEFDTKLTRELVELIDREADMLNRGRLGRNLEGLRTRIKHLFLTFIQTPEFNPEASRFQRIPIEFLDRPMIKPIPPTRYKAKTMTAEQIKQYQPLEI